MTGISDSTPRDSLSRIVVVGDGQLGVLAALALKQALPSAEVSIIGTPPDPAAWADRANTALPFTNRLHDRLNISEEDILAKAGGSHRLLTRLIGWGCVSAGDTAQHGAYAYGMATDASLKTRFAQEWGGRSRSDMASGPTERVADSLAEALAAKMRFGVPPGGMENPLSEVDYALRWHSPGYRHLIIQAAAALGVQHIKGTVAGALFGTDGGLDAIDVDGAGAIAADLFVDCSGPGAMVRSRLSNTKRTCWGDYLPVRRIAIGQPGQPVLSLEDRFSLPQEGWLSEIAGRDCLHMILGLTKRTSDDTIAAMFGQTPAETVDLAPGALDNPWFGNVVALGDAATQFEPLAFLNLDLAHRQLDLLIEMLPGKVINPRERKEYNRRAVLMTDAVRDVLSAHYAAPAAVKRFGKLARSVALDRMLDQFARRGRMPFHEEGPLLAQEMSGLLSALGLQRGLTPLAQAEGTADVMQVRDKFEAKVQAALEVAPPYGEWLGRFLRDNANA